MPRRVEWSGRAGEV
jgi:hypothetical protein